MADGANQSERDDPERRRAASVVEAIDDVLTCWLSVAKLNEQRTNSK